MKNENKTLSSLNRRRRERGLQRNTRATSEKLPSLNDASHTAATANLIARRQSCLRLLRQTPTEADVRYREQLASKYNGC